MNGPAARVEDLYAYPELYDAEFFAYRADSHFYDQCVQAHPGRVVELGCGTGRVYFQHAVASYVGVDRSVPMLRRFHARASRSSPLGRPWLACGDLRASGLAPGSAALVVLAYNVLQHMADERSLRAALKHAADLCRPGGAVALDVFMPPLPGQHRNDETFGGTEERRLADGRVVLVDERSVYDHATGTQQTTLWFRGPDERHLQFSRRLWDARVIDDAIVAAGLREELRWGDTRGEAWNPRSPRLMVAAQRP